MLPAHLTWKGVDGGASISSPAGGWLVLFRLRQRGRCHQWAALLELVSWCRPQARSLAGSGLSCRCCFFRCRMLLLLSGWLAHGTSQEARRV